MLDAILNKVGLIRKSRIGSFRDLTKEPLTEEELSLMLAEKIGEEEDYTEEDERKIYKKAKEVDGLVELLRNAAARDKNRYFAAASAQEQLIIRGAFARTMYLRSRIMNAGDPPKSKIKGLRYT